jgi:hypothetical protein
MASSDKLDFEKSETYSEAAHIETTGNPDAGDPGDDSIEQTDTGRVTWLISATVSLGGFLFGIVLSHRLFH